MKGKTTTYGDWEMCPTCGDWLVRDLCKRCAGTGKIPTLPGKKRPMSILFKLFILSGLLSLGGYFFFLGRPDLSIFIPSTFQFVFMLITSYIIHCWKPEWPVKVYFYWCLGGLTVYFVIAFLFWPAVTWQFLLMIFIIMLFQMGIICLFYFWKKRREQLSRN